MSELARESDVRRDRLRNLRAAFVLATCGLAAVALAGWLARFIAQ